MSRHNRWWQVADAEDGLGLIEVMVAIFVLAIALLALASVGVTSLGSLRVTRDREQATNAASAAIEDARRRDFGALAHMPGTIDVSELPPGARPAGSTDACFGGEPVVTDAVVEPVPFVRSAGNRGAITVHTLVTYADPEATGPICGAGATDLKRVTAIAWWTDGSVTRFVQQDTLVVEAGRGLPVPRFEVRPPESSVRFSHAFLTDPPDGDQRRCVEQQLRNLGAEDSYDWEVEAITSGGGTIGPPTGGAFRVGPTGRSWLVTGYLEYPALVELRGGTPPPTDDDLMTDAGGVPRPASDERVEPGTSATFTVCYEPAGDIPPTVDEWPADLTLTVAVRSRFDDRQVRRVAHHLSVVDQAGTVDPDAPPGTPYYLFDWKDDEAHPRTQPKPSPPSAGTPVLLPLLMGPLAPSDASPELPSHLGTIDYADPSKSNWSTDVATGRPGVQLRNSSPTDTSLSANTAVWHRQFQSPTTLLPQSTLVVWSAPSSALTGGLPVDGREVSLQVRVDRLHKNESNVLWSANPVSYTYLHADPGWQKVQIPVGLGAERTFATDEYLRVRVTCVSSNAEDCNLAYDNETYPSAYYVQVK